MAIKYEAMALLDMAEKEIRRYRQGHISRENFDRQWQKITQTINTASDKVRREFCRLYQDRLAILIDQSYEINDEQAALMTKQFFKDIAPEQWLVNYTVETLKERASPQMRFLRQEFNKLPRQHPDNPAKTVQVYRRAAQTPRW